MKLEGAKIYGCAVEFEQFLRDNPGAKDGWPLYTRDQVVACHCCRRYYCKRHYGGHKLRSEAGKR